jgi:acyl carrier protein
MNATYVVYAAIDSLNEQLSDERKIRKDPTTVLLGNEGKLDSIGFVNFVVLLEEKCQQECGVSISLTETSAEENPFESVGSLIEYLERRLGVRKTSTSVQKYA